MFMTSASDESDLHAIMDLIVFPSNSYIEVLISSTSEFNLIWKWCHYRCNLLRCGHTEIRWAFNPIGLVYLLKGELWTQTCTPGDDHVKIKANSMVTLHKPRNTRWPANHQKLRERHGQISPSQTFKGTNCADILFLDF